MRWTTLLVEGAKATVGLAGAHLEKARADVIEQNPVVVKLRGQLAAAEASASEAGGCLIDSEARRRELEALLEPPDGTDVARWRDKVDEAARILREGDGPMVVLERAMLRALVDVFDTLVARVTMLRNALNRDRTGLAAALVEVIRTADGYTWVTWGRGSYEWDDERYREETGRALAAIRGLAHKALQDSGTLATLAIRGGELPADLSAPVPLDVALRGLLIDDVRLAEIMVAHWNEIRDVDSDRRAFCAWEQLDPWERAGILRACRVAMRAALAASTVAPMPTTAGKVPRG